MIELSLFCNYRKGSIFGGSIPLTACSQQEVHSKSKPTIQTEKEAIFFMALVGLRVGFSKRSHFSVDAEKVYPGASRHRKAAKVSNRTAIQKLIILRLERLPTAGKSVRNR